MPVQKSEIPNWLSHRSEATVSAVETIFEKLDGVYFLTDTERMVISAVRDAAEWGEEPTEGWEKFTSDLAEKMKEQYGIQMKE